MCSRCSLQTTMTSLNWITALLLFYVVLCVFPTQTYGFGAGDIPDFAYLNGERCWKSEVHLSTRRPLDKAFRHGDIENILRIRVDGAKVHGRRLILRVYSLGLCKLIKRHGSDATNEPSQHDSYSVDVLWIVVFYTLKNANQEKQYFNLRTDVYSFMSVHWEKLCLSKDRTCPARPCGYEETNEILVQPQSIGRNRCFSLAVRSSSARAYHASSVCIGSFYQTHHAPMPRFYRETSSSA